MHLLMVVTRVRLIPVVVSLDRKVLVANLYDARSWFKPGSWAQTRESQCIQARRLLLLEGKGFCNQQDVARRRISRNRKPDRAFDGTQLAFEGTASLR